MTTPTQMPESLKAVAWRDDGLSASNGTDGPDYRVVTDKTKQSMPHAAVVAYTDALVLLADAQSALKDRDAEIERLKKDAEQWKPIDGFVGYYQISSLGRVRSLDRIDSDGKRRKGVFMAPFRKTKKGYLAIAMNKDGEATEEYIHRLVACAFLPNDAALPQVNHIDGDPANNSASNLEWVTNAENQRHARRILAKGVRAVYGVSTSTGGRIEFPSLQHAVEAGFVRANIQKCIAGERGTHRGHKWFDAAIDSMKGDAS